jgi:hypothetical protein
MNQLIFVMVKCGVLFEVRTELLNIIKRSFLFKGLNIYLYTAEEWDTCKEGHTSSNWFRLNLVFASLDLKSVGQI